MMLPGAENQAALLPVLLQSINEQTNPLLQNHFHSVATNRYVFHKTSKLIEDYISKASGIISLSSNQLLFQQDSTPTCSIRNVQMPNIPCW
jgi:hypothetical protein